MPAWGAGRVATDVAEATVERYHKAVFTKRSSEDIRVARATELLVNDGVDVMAECYGRLTRLVWKVLVELDLH